MTLPVQKGESHMNDWNGKPYHSLDYELKRQFGQKIYKLSLESGMTSRTETALWEQGAVSFAARGEPVTLQRA